MLPAIDETTIANAALSRKRRSARAKALGSADMDRSLGEGDRWVSGSELQVEHDRVAAGRRGDAELHDPPAAHVELHSLHEVIAVAEIARDLWLRREAMAVLGHAAVDRDLAAIDGCAVRRLEMEPPAVQLALGDAVALRTNRRSVGSGCAQ